MTNVRGARSLYPSVLWAVPWLALSACTYAQSKPALAAFDVTGYAVAGAPLLGAADFSRIVAPYIGTRKTALDVQNAQRMLQQAYWDLGHCSVQVTVPQAAPEAGVVTFKILQSRVPVSKDCLPMMALEPSSAAVANASPEVVPAVASEAAWQFQARTVAFRQGETAQSAASPLIAAPAVEPLPAPRLQASDTAGRPAEPAPVQRVAQAPPAAADAAAPRDQAAAPMLRFDIERYEVTGNTLLKKDVIAKSLQPYTGKQKDFADVQRALEALQLAYQKAGWGTVQVTLPEQELERGEVRFEVIETRVGKIEAQAGEYFNQANALRSVPSLKAGSTPNSLALARSLRVANENPAKQTQVSLKAGSTDGEVDAAIKVVDENPRKYSLNMDNTGTSQTGQFRVGFGFQHANLWNRDHQLTLQYITNPEHVSKVTVLGAGYHIPLYGLGDSIDFLLGYSDVDSGTVPQVNLNVTGAGLIVLARYNHNLNRIEDYEHKLTFGLDYKAFQSRVTTTAGAPLVPDITLHPVSVAYAGELRRTEDNLNFYASFSYNPFPGGNDAAQSDFSGFPGSQFPTGARARATAEYSIWRFGGSYTRILPRDWTLRLAASGQTTSNALVAGEQFGVGGANSVRGFNERAYSNDKGHQATVELYTPDLAGKLGFGGARLKLLAFYDTGSLGRNLLQAGEQTGLGVDSIGLGLRLNVRDKLNVHLDYAQVKHDGGRDAGLPDGRRNSNTVHALAVWVF